MTPPQLVVGDGESQLREASQQRPEGEVPLQPGERGAEAVVDAVSEGEVTGARTVDVEHLGIVVHALVVVRGRQADDDLGAGGDRHPAQFDRLDGVPERRVRDRGVEAQELLQRRREPSGIGDEAAPVDPGCGTGRRRCCR